MYQFSTYNSYFLATQQKYALTTYSNINTSLVCVNPNVGMYLTQLLKGRDYIRYINSIYYIKTIDNIVLILLSQFNFLLFEINYLFRETKPFDNHVNLLLLPSYKHFASILTFVYPTFESILFDIDEKYKSSNVIHFKYIYITLSLAAYIHNISLEICNLLYVKDKLISQKY